MAQQGDSSVPKNAPHDAGVAHAHPEETRHGSGWIDDVWRRHRRWIAAIVLAHKPRTIDADDLLQDVALSVVRKVGELRDPASIKPWLRTVAINACLASGRAASARAANIPVSSRASARAADDEADVLARIGEPAREGHETAAQHLATTEEAHRLTELAMQLPEGYREPLLLKAVRGMSYREIGLVLELPESTIETRIARARRMLRDLAQQAERARPSAVP